MNRLCLAALAGVMACGSAFAQGRLPSPTLGSAVVVGSSPANSGAVFTITNNTQPTSANQVDYEIFNHASYPIPTFGSGVRPREFRTDLSVPAGVTSTTIHENFWSSNYMTGAGTSGVEINQFHAYFENNMTGHITGNVEGYESSALNNGVMGGYQDYLALFHNGSSATITSVAGFKTQLTNDNVAAGSVGSFAGFDCEAKNGSGSNPSFNYCIRNADPNGIIASNGNMIIGSISPGSATLQVHGPDQSSNTVAFKVTDSTGTTLFNLADDGTAHSVGNLTVGTLSPSNVTLFVRGPDQLSSSSVLGAVDSAGVSLFRVFDDGVVAAPVRMVVGSLSAGTQLLGVKGPDQLSSTVAIGVLDGTGTTILQVRDDATIGMSNKLSVGTISTQGATFTAKGPDQSSGTVNILALDSTGTSLFQVRDNGSAAIVGQMVVGTLSIGSAMFKIKGADQLAASSAFNITDSTDSNLFSIHDDGSISTKNIAAVSCLAASVNLTTLVVTNGLVTHC